MSSAHVARCGRKSDSSMPHWPCLRELARAAQQRGRLLLDEGEAHVLGHRLGQRLAVQFVELRLGVEQVDLARRAFEVDADAVLGLRRRSAAAAARADWPRRAALGGEQAVVAAAATPGPAGRRRWRPWSGSRGGTGGSIRGSGAWQLARSASIYSRVTNSSRFSSVRASATQAAASAPVDAGGSCRGPASFAAALGVGSALREQVVVAAGRARPAPLAVGSRARHEPEGVARAARRSPPGDSVDDPPAQGLGALDEDRSFSSVSACSGVFERSRRTRADVRVGGVEGHQHRVRAGPLEPGVQAAAIAVGAGALDPLGAAGVGQLGDPGRLRRTDARPADARLRAARWRPAPRRGRSRPRAAAGSAGPASTLFGSRSTSSGRAATTADRWPR